MNRQTLSKTLKSERSTLSEDSPDPSPSTTPTDSATTALQSHPIEVGVTDQTPMPTAQALAELAAMEAAEANPQSWAEKKARNKARKKMDTRSAYTLKQGWVSNHLLKYPRNAPCPCKSGKKFKQCCLDKMPAALPKGVDPYASTGNQLSQQSVPTPAQLQAVSCIHTETKRDSEP